MENKFSQFNSFENLDIDSLIDKEKELIEYLILTEYKNGLSITSIRKNFGISQYKIKNTFKKYNISFRPSGTKPIDNDLSPQIIESYNNGESGEQIGKRLGIHPSTICRTLKKV